MTKILNFKKILNAYLILIFKGWRSVEILGVPKEELGTYLVCLQNNAVMEYSFANFGEGGMNWWKIGIGDESIHNKVIYWRRLPKPPYKSKQ